MSNNVHSSYDRNALKQIESFKRPSSILPAFLASAVDTVSSAVDSGADFVMDNAVGDIMRKATAGVVDVAMDAASWTVWTSAILEEFRTDGHCVKQLDDIRLLELEQVDKTVGYLGAKYKALALTTGGASGAIGLPGIPISVAALVALSLRAVAEYATYYGCSVELQSERLYALQVLSLAATPSAAAKQLMLANLAQAGKMAAKKASWAVLQQQAVVRAIQRIAQSLGIHLTKAKLAQVVPVVGAATGAGFDAWFMANVTEAAYHCYRERFLQQKYTHLVE